MVSQAAGGGSGRRTPGSPERGQAEAAETLRKVIEAMEAMGTVGSITIKLDVEPADGLMHAVVVQDRISQKVPEKTREGSMAFITQAGDPSRTDPSAMPLFTDATFATPADESTSTPAR